MHLGVGVAYPAWQLWQLAVFVEETELVERVLAVLSLHVFEMHRPTVYPHGCARLHPVTAYAMAGDALREVVCRRLGDAPTLHLARSDMHQSVEERARREHDAPGVERGAPDGFHAHGHTVFHQQLLHLVLPDVEVRRVVERLSPFPNEFAAVALCPGTPHGRSFRHVEHAELYRRGIGHQTHLSAHGIYLAHDLSFGDASHSGVA